MTSTTFSITLSESSDSIYLGKKMREYVPLEVVQSFVQNKMGISFKQCKGKRYAGINTKFETEQNQMEAYLSTYNKELECFETTYYIPSHGYGRVEPVDYLSLSKFHRPTRHAFAGERYVDIDMCCAHPVLFAQICRSATLPSHGIESYARDYKQWRVRIMETYGVSKDIAKQLPIRLCFGGSIANWKLESNIHPDYMSRDIAEVVELEKELAVLMPILFNANPRIADALRKYDPVKYADVNQLQRSVMAMWSQTVERLAQEACAKWLVREKGVVLEDIVPSQDGLMILKEFWYDGILSDMSNVVRRDLDLGIEWAQKDFDEAITIPPVDTSRLPNAYSITVEQLGDPYECAKTIHRSLVVSLVYCRGEWVMLTSSNLWRRGGDPSLHIITELRRYIDKSNEKTVVEISKASGDHKDKLIERSKQYLKSYKAVSSSGFLNVLTKYLKTELTDDKFANKLDNTPDVLAFQNGMVDLRTKAFRKGILSSDFLTQTIPFDYTPCADYSFVKSQLLMILNNDPVHLDYFLSLIGYTFIGRPNLEKDLYFMIDKTLGGRGDNGKTFFFDILQSLMPNYVYSPNASLIAKDNTKVHKQLAKTKGVRLLYLEELPREKNTNADLLKKLGDGMNIENEVMFGTSEQIEIMFKVFALSNHVPKIDPNETAVYNRYKQVSFNSHFDRTGTRKEADPSQLLFIADKTLGDLIKSERYAEVFALVIDYANRYYGSKLPAIPEKFVADTKETQAVNDVYVDWFNSNCVADAIKRVPIKVLVKESNISEKEVKLGMERLGFRYNRELKGMGKDPYTGSYYKGGYEGVQYVEERGEEPDDTDIETEGSY
jgi:phage/plasmid-associated DNA primase